MTFLNFHNENLLDFFIFIFLKDTEPDPVSSDDNDWKMVLIFNKNENHALHYYSNYRCLE